MSTLFISDLHLDAQYPQLTKLFFEFIHTKAIHAEALYVLGDLFEVWIGDDEQTPFQQQIANTFKQLVDKGVKVYLMHGNRDFLLGAEFCRVSGCQLIPDPYAINLYGENILLLHGDGLCTKDNLHMYFRRLSRNGITKYFFGSLPLNLRKRIANYIRQKSKTRGLTLSAEIMDINFNAAKQLLAKQNSQFMIHGHTHQPSIHMFKTNEHYLTRIVLSDWHNYGNYLEINPQLEKRLVNFICDA